MSIEARLKRLEELASASKSPHRPLHTIAWVETIVRLADGSYGRDTRYHPDDPQTTAKISEAVRAVVEVIETEGDDAGWRWFENLKAELLPGYDRPIVRLHLERDAERFALKRGDLPATWEPVFPELFN